MMYHGVVAAIYIVGLYTLGFVLKVLWGCKMVQWKEAASVML